MPEVFKPFRGIDTCDMYALFDFNLLTLGKCAADLLPSPRCFSVSKWSMGKNQHKIILANQKIVVLIMMTETGL